MARILQAVEQPGGGTAEHVLRLTAGLRDCGHHVEVAGAAENQIYEALGAAGVTVHRLPFVGNLVAPLTDARALIELIALLRRGGFEVAHAHGAKAGALLRLAGRFARVPVVYSPHQFAFVANEFRPLRFPRFRRLLTVWIERLLGPLGSRLICVSEFELEAARRERIGPKDGRRLVYHGVEVDQSASADAEMLEWRGDGVLVGAVSALRTEKGLEYLVRAASDPRFGSGDVRFAIVGNGPERETLAAMIEREGLQGRVRLFPFSGAVEPHLKALDVFTLPSHLFEVLSIGTVEAMACSLPVVASAVGGVPEVVADGESGYLVPPADPGAMASAIARLTSDPALRTGFGERARQIAGSKFQLGRMIEEIESIYAELW